MVLIHSEEKSSKEEEEEDCVRIRREAEARPQRDADHLLPSKSIGPNP